MRTKIITRLLKIKEDEENFQSSWWRYNYVSYNEDTEELISDVDFTNLNDDDLLRIFEYVLLTRDEISTIRVNETFFKELK